MNERTLTDDDIKTVWPAADEAAAGPRAETDPDHVNDTDVADPDDADDADADDDAVDEGGDADAADADTPA